MSLSREARELLIIALCSRRRGNEIANAIDAVEMDALSLHLSGNNSPLANINWGGFKLTNLANATLAGDAVNKSQLDLKAPLASPVFTGTVTTPELFFGAVQYRFKTTLDSMILQSQKTATYSFLDLYAFDSDGTDQVGFAAFAKGGSDFSGASEFGQFGWRPDNSSFTLETGAFGGGTVRPWVIRTQGNATQLVLNTNNSINASGQFRAASLGVGNSVAATVPGSVTKKIEIFDAAGVSLGFVAIFDAIT